MLNQRLDLFVIVAAIFLAIFVATSVILLVFGVPARDAGPVADTAPPTTRPPDRPRVLTVPNAPTPPPVWRDERAFRYGSSRDEESVIDGYRFRPLDEREASRFGGWAAPPEDRSADGPGERDRGLGDLVFRRDDRLPEGFTSDWWETPYRFRPTEPSRSVPDPWRPQRDPRGPRGFTDPGLFEPPPQWGATPPMLPPPLPDLYPSLGSPSDHRLTLR